VLLNSKVGYLTVCCSILILISQSFILTARVVQLESANESSSAERKTLEAESQTKVDQYVLEVHAEKENSASLTGELCF
jgi:hypothetical protein